MNTVQLAIRWTDKEQDRVYNVASGVIAMADALALVNEMLYGALCGVTAQITGIETPPYACTILCEQLHEITSLDEGNILPPTGYRGGYEYEFSAAYATDTAAFDILYFALECYVLAHPELCANEVIEAVKREQRFRAAQRA